MSLQVELFLAGFTNSSGSPLNAGKVYTYEAGTTTPKATYQDYTLSTPHANPIILDAQGRKLVFAAGSFKLVIKDSGDNTLYTFDNLFFAGRNYTTLPIIQAGEYSWGGTSGGTANAHTVTLTPTPTALEPGMVIKWIPSVTNTTTTPTLNVNGLGAVTLVKAGGGALYAGDLPLRTVTSVFDGTSFVTYGLAFQSGLYEWGGTSGGTANAQTITLAPAITAYVTGALFRFRPSLANTGSATLNVNGLGAKTLKRINGDNLLAGDLNINSIIECVYDGTNLICISGLIPTWIDYSGTITYGTDSGSIGSTVTTKAEYKKLLDGRIALNLSFTGTITGTPNYVTASLPVNAANTANQFGARGSTGATPIGVQCYTGSTSQVWFRRYDGATWAAAAFGGHCTGEYQP